MVRGTASDRRGAGIPLADILGSAPVAVAVLSGPDLRFEFVNAAVAEITERDDLVGRPLGEAFPGLASQGVLERFVDVYRTGTAFEFAELRVELPDRDGQRLETRWFSGRALAHRAPDGAILGVVGVGVEITSHMKARHALEARRAEIARDERHIALGQLVSGVAHELRTPLTYLATNLDLIDRILDRLDAATLDDARASAKEHVESAHEAVDRIKSIIEDLRDIGHPRARAREPARIDDVIGQAVRMFQVAHATVVTIRYEPASDAILPLDKLQLQQAILNLLQNALDAKPRDRTIVVRTARSDGAVRVEVADTGDGIGSDAQPNIFEPFFTTRERGTGLGLSIVRRVVEEHEGKIGFESGPSGTRFLIDLPSPS